MSYLFIFQKVDALYPALNHLQLHSRPCINELLDDLWAACSVAKKAAKKTAGMQAK